MTMTNEARRLMPPILLEDNGFQNFRSNRIGNNKIPGDQVFRRIIEQKDDVKDLYTTLATISNINALYMNSSVKTAIEIIEYIEISYKRDDD